jgi:phosphohistidine phosphatase
MNLFILRHASAGTRRLNPLLDIKRPLDKEGKQYCLQLAHVMNTLKISFDVILSSPLKRALQTAQFVATETGYEAQIQHSPALSPEASFADFQKLLQQLEDKENVLVVGHSPNIQVLLGSVVMAGLSSSTPKAIPPIRMRKGAIGRVAITRGQAQLQALWDPRVIRALYATSTKSSRRNTSKK